MIETQWQIVENLEISPAIITAILPYIEQLNLQNSEGKYIAQLLQQRGIIEPQKIAGFLDPNYYNPVSPFEFGQEMKCAVNRLLLARKKGEKIAIWGDFDADGITSTSVLWEGLGQFFKQEENLTYYIPNRLTESHGLNEMGINKLKAENISLIVTCDTGSTNLQEIEFAQTLGIDIIVTDHHTLPEDRPPVISIINPRYFASTHPLFHLSGVAVAYKLIEALYLTVPQIPHQPLENLLDLVAIGLIADLVSLEGDCRYLAQKGLQQLQKQSDILTSNRPGVTKLLKYCKATGDRPTDISFGIGPRINAVSRIHGDGHFGVELLTSKDDKRCEELASYTELANSRRKELQQNTLKNVKKKLEQLDLSTTSVIVLADSQWQGGVLGLVAGQIAQEYGRPTVLLSYSEGKNKDEPIFARGSARSIQSINLYDLVNSQAHLLHRFGGHPFAAGLSLPFENIELFKEGINQELRQNYQLNFESLKPTITADLTVTVAELGKDLFRELKLLEPCGMGNPPAKLLLKNCCFKNVWNKKIEDLRKSKLEYKRTFFKIWDETARRGFDGIWWGHSSEEISQNQRYDVIVELDYNKYEAEKNFKKKNPDEYYQVRIIDLKESFPNYQDYPLCQSQNNIIDYRREQITEKEKLTGIIVKKCPLSWYEIKQHYQQAKQLDQSLTLAYNETEKEAPEIIWQKLIGIAKYLSRTGEKTTLEKIKEKLNLSDRSVNLGLQALEKLGFQCYNQLNSLQITKDTDPSASKNLSLNQFIAVVREEQFQHEYFYHIPLTTVQNVLYYEE